MKTYKSKYGRDFTIKKGQDDDGVPCYEMTCEGITYLFAKDELDEYELKALKDQGID